MRRETAELLQRLEAIDWFFAVGQQMTDVEVGYVHSWEEAVTASTSDHWLEICHEMREGYRGRLHVRAPDRSWNAAAREIGPVCENLVRRKVTDVVDIALADRFYKHVRYQIDHLLIEHEFSDVVEPGFFTTFTKFYLSGHFPCDWDGNLAEKTTEQQALDAHVFRPIVPVWNDIPDLKGRLVIF